MKARITRPDGTVIDLEGTPAEIREVLDPAPIGIEWIPQAPTWPEVSPPWDWTWRPDTSPVYGTCAGVVFCQQPGCIGPAEHGPYCATHRPRPQSPEMRTWP